MLNAYYLIGDQGARSWPPALLFVSAGTTSVQAYAKF